MTVRYVYLCFGISFSTQPSVNVCVYTYVGRGLYYLKGGDFLSELTTDAQVSEYALHEVRNLVPNLQTDKNVLFIPQSEIAAFRARQTKHHPSRIEK
jgi:hypothetical protein